MNIKKPLVLIVFAAVTTFASKSHSHPSLVPVNTHPHSTNNIIWELDLVEDGNTAHNHFDLFPLHGGATFRQPSTFSACWDNETIRLDNNAPLFYSKGHCFINQVAINAVPAYFFEDGSVSWPTGAKDRIREAFDAWSNIITLGVPTELGLGFVESSTAQGARIIVRWKDIPDNNNGGIGAIAEDLPILIVPEILTFDSSLDWSFASSKSAVPAGKWHFFSVALHEVGHFVGLDHQPFDDVKDVMMSQSGRFVGAPINQGGRHFDYIDDDSAFGAARLYSQSIPPPPQSCTMSASFNGCNAPQSYTFTAYLPGYSVNNMDVDYKNGTSGPWHDLYEGIFTCPGYSSQTTRTVRSILTTAYGLSQCELVIRPHNCDEPPE